MKALAAVLVAMLPAAAHAACDVNAVEIRDTKGNVSRFSVEVADDVAERAQGLMNRESMPRSAGMLFLYDRPQSVSFWMENTLIPLDMIFADDTGTVRHIHENAVPLDRTPIPGGDGILAVLEINGGLATRMGITEGAVLRHPALDQSDAAWKCDAE